MIFLEEITNQALMEEGQIILSLTDYDLTWQKLERLFVGTFNQAKDYLLIFDWTTQNLSPNAIKVPNLVHVKNIVYNSYQKMQRFMPTIEQQLWEFNPYTKDLKALVSTSFGLEYSKHATCDYLPYSITLSDVKADTAYPFALPCSFRAGTFTITTTDNQDVIDTVEEKTDESDNVFLEISGTMGEGQIDPKTLDGYITPVKDYTQITLELTSKYKGLLELDMTEELFYNWYKANLLSLLGGIKDQIELPGVGLPFDLTRDTLSQKAGSLMATVNDLKVTKSHWSNF